MSGLSFLHMPSFKDHSEFPSDLTTATIPQSFALSSLQKGRHRQIHDSSFVILWSCATITSSGRKRDSNVSAVRNATTSATVTETNFG